MCFHTAAPISVVQSEVTQNTATTRGHCLVILADWCGQQTSPRLLWAGEPWASHLQGSPIRAGLLGPWLPAALASGQGQSSYCGRTRGKVCRFIVTCVLRVFCTQETVLFQWDIFFQEVRKYTESSDWDGGAASFLHPQAICLLGTQQINHCILDKGDAFVPPQGRSQRKPSHAFIVAFFFCSFHASKSCCL